MIRKYQEKRKKEERKRERPYYTCTQLPLPATEMEAFSQGRPTSARVWLRNEKAIMKTVLFTIS